MNNTAIFVLVTILAIGAIFWLVIYSGRRGERHREKTSIRPSEPRKQENIS